MKQKPLGLDIGSNSIKAVWLSEDKAGFFLKSVTTADTPLKGLISESPLDQEEITQTIKSMLASAKITTNAVNIALPESQVYTRVIEMPMLSDNELSAAIYWEIEQHIPVPLSSITFDWKVLKRPSSSTDGSKIEVLMVGAPNTIIAKYQKVLSNAGLTINSVETEILSTIRPLVYSPLEAPDYRFPNSIVMNIGAVSTSLVIVKDGIIIFTYSIPAGGIAINRAIAADFGFSASQAEEYKKTYGVSEKEFGGKISHAAEPILMSIINEVKKAQAFYSEKYKDEQSIQQIILSGGTAKMPGIDLIFAENCNIETIVADPWKILINQELPEEVKKSASSFTVAIGLAMRDYE